MRFASFRLHYLRKTYAIVFPNSFILACSLILIMASLSRPAVRAVPNGTAIPQTGVTFHTSDPKLQKLYDQAERKAQWNIAWFGPYQVLVEGAGYDNVWLETQPMGGYMYAQRNLAVARNNIQIFADYQRADGRLPGMISRSGDSLIAHYGWFQGYCFPMPAFELYYWLNWDKAYLQQLYQTLEAFDRYLWKTRDSDQDGCLESWCICDTGEDHCIRFNRSPWFWPYDDAPTSDRLAALPESELKEMGIGKKDPAISFSTPLPMESMDVMSYSYSGRDVLARIAQILGNGQAAYWRNQADAVRIKLKDRLWNEAKHACYDLDKNNQVMEILLHNNLRCMYFGSFDQQMADAFIRHHLLNPDEFWTPMPLPSIAANDPSFRNIAGNNWSGQPQGLTFQRSIRALENYGHYAEVTMIGKKFLQAIGDSMQFTQQFDPFTGKVDQTKDGYGPSILSALEFISRLYGIHLTQDMIYWSCLDDAYEHDYTQRWGKRSFRMTTQGRQAHCYVNGKKVVSFTRGIRIISDVQGKRIYAVGIDTKPQQAIITYRGKNISLTIEPNTVYDSKKNFNRTRWVEFNSPAEP